MKHITFSDKSLLVDDTTADLLIEYAALLITHGIADSVQVHAFSSDGDETDATFLLSAGAPLMAETTLSSVDEPDNHQAITYMRDRILGLTTRPRALPVDEVDLAALALIDRLEI